MSTLDKIPILKNLKKQQLMIGGKPFTVFAKIQTVGLRSVIYQKHAIGAQRDHIQHMGVGSKTCIVEGYTSVPYYESGLWTIELYQRAGLPIPFVSQAFTSLVYIRDFQYRRNADRGESIVFRIEMIEKSPIASLIGGIVQRTTVGTKVGKWLNEPEIRIGFGEITGSENYG